MMAGASVRAVSALAFFLRKAASQRSVSSSTVMSLGCAATGSAASGWAASAVAGFASSRPSTSHSTTPMTASSATASTSHHHGNGLVPSGSGAASLVSSTQASGPVLRSPPSPGITSRRKP